MLSAFSGQCYSEKDVDYWAQRMYWEGLEIRHSFPFETRMLISARVAEYVHIEIDNDSFFAFVDRFANPLKVQTLQTPPVLKGSMMHLPGGLLVCLQPVLETVRRCLPEPPSPATAYQVLDRVCSFPVVLSQIVVDYYVFR